MLGRVNIRTKYPKIVRMLKPRIRGILIQVRDPEASGQESIKGREGFSRLANLWF